MSKINFFLLLPILCLFSWNTSHAQFNFTQLSSYQSGKPTNPSDAFQVNDSVYFFTTDNSMMKGLGKSDGLTSGITTHNLSYNNYIIRPEWMHPLKDNILLYGNHKDGKNHLYVYTPNDGDITELVLNTPYTYTALAEDNNGPIYHADGSIYFFAYNGMRHSLWKTDGTNSGTVLVYTLPNKAYSVLDKSYYAIEDSSIAFVGEVTSLGYQIIVKDLSTGYGASLVDPNNKLWSNPEALSIYNGRLYFTAVTNDGRGREPWVSDGTFAGTHLIGDIYDGAFGSNINSFISYKDLVLFTGAVLEKNSTYKGAEWVVYHPEKDSFHLLYDVNPGPGNGAFMSKTYIANDGRLFFTGTDSSNNVTNLWVTDGTSQGTKKWFNRNDLGFGYIPPPHGEINGGFIFSHGQKLYWRKNESSEPILIKDANNAAISDDAAFLKIWKNGILVRANYNGISDELFRVEYPAPALGSDQVICPGQSIQINTGYDTTLTKHLWSDGSTNNQLQITQAGVYWLETYTADRSYFYGRDSITISSETMTINLGADTALSFPYTLHAGAHGNYQWSTGSTDSFIVVNSPGIYWLNFTSPGGCAYSDSIKIDKLTSIETAIENRLVIYPNPTNRTLTIQLSNQKIKHAQVYTIQGQLLLQEQAFGDELELDVQQLASGVYYLQVMDESNEISKVRFVKVKH